MADSLETLTKEDISQIGEIQFESYLSTDGLRDLMSIIKSFPPATSQDNIELYRRLMAGDDTARDDMINRNLRLVVGTAMKNRKKLHSYEKRDVIHDGIMGLMDAIDKFDPEKGIFSTFACNWIRAAIGRGIDDHDDMIRRPTHFVNKRIKFAKLQRQNELEGKTLEASDIKGKLNITDEMLELLETDYQNEVKSLDETIIRQSPEDGEPTYLELIASDKHDSRNDMVKNLIDKELAAFLKMELTPYEYYIIYYRFLLPEQRMLSSIGREFGTTGEAIRQKENRTLRKIRRFYDRNRNFLGVCPRNIDNIKITPIEPSDIGTYLFVQASLSEKEQTVAKEILMGTYNDFVRRLSVLLSLSSSDTKDFIKRTMEKINAIVTEDRLEFETFYDKLISTYGSSIYKIDTDDMKIGHIGLNLQPTNVAK